MRLHHRFKGSTRVTRGWYDTEHQTIELEFKHGPHYVYLMVPPDIWQGLIESPSAGQYVSEVLDKYSYKSV